jgi:phosphonatase-like hydrolase
VTVIGQCGSSGRLAAFATQRATMTYHLAVFDMAGTTVQDPGLVADALAQALTDAGVPVPAEAARPLMGYDKPEAIRQLLRAHGAADLADDATPVARIHADFVARMIECYRTDPRVAPMPGAEAAFGQLRERGMRIALNTAFSRDIADTIVARFGWRERGLIDDLIAADEVPAGRPQPYMIATLRARAGDVTATAVVKIGDTEVDIAEGRNAGVGKVVSVTTGAYRREELLACQPDAVIDDLRELVALLADRPL